jgi:DNA-binding helix-hairpin-helix protein with protein kinase domain
VIPHSFWGPNPLPPLVSRTNLQRAVVKEGGFMAQTKPVWYCGQVYVTKGPTSAERARADLREVNSLLSLPTRHPNIVPPPAALITVAPDDDTICGFLSPLFKHGNLDCYARKVRAQATSFDQIMHAWYKQLVSAVKCLIDASTYHGDIKPDNILVSDTGQLVVINYGLSYGLPLLEIEK